MILAGFLSLMLISSLLSHYRFIFAQPYLQIKSRNLIINLGNGLRTDAQLTIPGLDKDAGFHQSSSIPD